jgi:alpha-methylacyl-CoA racemase
VRLCQLLERPDLASRQFADGAERLALFECFASIFRSKTRDQWMRRFHGEDVCVAPVLTPGEAAEAVEMQRNRATSADGAPLVRSPVRLEVAAPAMPSGTAATLASFGFTAEEIRSLQAHRSVGG